MKDEFYDLPEEYRNADEISNSFKDEFEYFNIPKVQTGKTLKERYNKMLKIMKLATSVSLAAVTMSVSIPTIIPIIKIDASEDKKEEIVVKEEIINEEIKGIWNVSGIKHVTLIDDEEVVDKDINVSDISYSIDLEGDEVYLTYYENGENLNSTLLKKINDNTLYCHQIRQNEEEVDIYVSLNEEVLIIKVIGKTTINDISYDDVTYYYCGKDGGDYSYTPTVVTPDHTTCEVCEGTGITNCPTCLTLGQVTCDECNGSGYLEEADEVCEGTGECINCKGLGYLEETLINEETGEEETSQTTCESCSGSGICVSCNGSGHKLCDKCSTIEDNLPGYIICEKCNGQGTITCINCEGTGEVTVSLLNDEDLAEETIEDINEIEEKAE